MHTSWKVAAAAAGLLITGTALRHPGRPCPKPIPEARSVQVELHLGQRGGLRDGAGAHERRESGRHEAADGLCWARATTSATGPPPASP